jgi:hypothetical protein
LRGENVEGGITKRGLIIDNYDGINGTLVFTGLAFNTFLGVDRFWPFTYPLIHFARTNLNAVAATIAGLLIEFGTHGISLPQKK